jgi:hypothetical protein
MIPKSTGTRIVLAQQEWDAVWHRQRDPTERQSIDCRAEVHAEITKPRQLPQSQCGAALLIEIHRGYRQEMP